MLSISPGNAPQYQVTFEPEGLLTSIDNIGWAVQASDGSEVSMTSNDDDETGSTATLSISSDTAVGAVLSFWAVYRNPSGSEALIGPVNVTVVG